MAASPLLLPSPGSTPRRLLGHCPQAQVPEAGVFPFCSSVGHRPEGRLRGIWKETLGALHPDSSQQDCVGHVLPTLAGLRGLPAGRSSGWVDTRCGLFSSVLGSDCHLTLSTQPLLVSSRHMHRRAASMHTQKAGHVACVQFQTNPVSTCGVTAWLARQRFLNIFIFVGVHEYFINLI